MGERLLVEFGVEKTVDAGFGYSEKFLTYNGEKIPYKAILKEGKVVAIMHRGYKLIPHELVLRYLESDKWFVRNDERVGGRMYLTLGVSGKDWVDVLVVNSVDGSHSLTANLCIHFSSNGNSFKVMVTQKSKAIELAKIIHKKSADVKVLPAVVEELVGKADFIKSVYQTIFEKDAREFKIVWDWLKDTIPEKYTKQIMYKMAFSKDPVPVKVVYEDVSKRIMNTDNDMMTKMKFLQSLDEAVWMIYDSMR